MLEHGESEDVVLDLGRQPVPVTLSKECKEQGVTKMTSNLVATKYDKQASQVHVTMKVKLECGSDD